MGKRCKKCSSEEIHKEPLNEELEKEMRMKSITSASQVAKSKAPEKSKMKIPLRWEEQVRGSSAPAGWMAVRQTPNSWIASGDEWPANQSPVT